MSARLLGAKQVFFIKPGIIKREIPARGKFKVLPASKTTLISARARKYKLTARMLANSRKDRWIPLQVAGSNKGKEDRI